MEYFLQLLEALDEYGIMFNAEPAGGMEEIHEWTNRCAVLERRIWFLTDKCKEIESDALCR